MKDFFKTKSKVFFKNKGRFYDLIDTFVLPKLFFEVKMNDDTFSFYAQKKRYWKLET